MPPLTDAQLLRDYATAGSQTAFAELVKRHVHLVHAAALRQSHGDPHRADDITQAVFVVLSRRAKSIGDGVSIPGWLINTTRYASLSAIKLESRRRHHERRATAMARTAAAAAAACVVIGGVAAPLVMNAAGPAPAPAAAATPAPAPAPTMPVSAVKPPVVAPALPASQPAPVILPNVTFFQNVNGREFTVGVDDATRRTPTSDSAVILTSNTPRWGGFGTALRGVDPAPFRGKRIRFSAYVKCKDLANGGGLWLFTADARERIYAADDLCDRALTKTADWQRMAIVADVPPEVDSIRCGLKMLGKGEIWMDAPQIEVVPDTVPITDDQLWHAWSFSMPHYKTRLDPTTPRNGKPTRLLESSVAGVGEWLSWDRNDRHPEPYLGKRMKVSMWIKTQNVTGPSGILLSVRGPNFQEIIPGLSKAARTIRGTTPWTKYEFTADIPPDTQNLCTGVRLGGKGKLWVDDVQYEMVK
jgi:DNA-directed RNA polymerase specialized sigma24 family protein